MSDTLPSPESAAPAPPGPEPGSSDQVDIALGPDVSLYPEHLRPVEPPAPPASAPEPDQASAPEPSAPDVAGAADSAEPRGTRRRAGEDAYQRGLTEGR